MNFVDRVFKDYSDDPEEIVGRYIVNQFGVAEIVTLKQVHWDYLEWLDQQGADIERFVGDCERANPDYPLSGALQWWIYWALQSRDTEGLPRPNWLKG